MIAGSYVERFKAVDGVVEGHFSLLAALLRGRRMRGGHLTRIAPGLDDAMVVDYRLDHFGGINRKASSLNGVDSLSGRILNMAMT